MTLSPWSKAFAAALTLASSVVAAAPVSALSYDMPNGDGQASGGTYNYWDRNYSGSGATTTDGAALSGGLGKLTDGVVSTSFWYDVSNDAGTGEYVGWLATVTLNPLLTFAFTPGTLIDSITIQMDNTNVGGVFAPVDILIDGVSLPFTPPADGAVGSVVFSGLALSGGSHTIQFVQDPRTWTFVSEIAFDGEPGRGVPEPASLALSGLALALLARGRSRRAA